MSDNKKEPKETTGHVRSRAKRGEPGQGPVQAGEQPTRRQRRIMLEPHDEWLVDRWTVPAHWSCVTWCPATTETFVSSDPRSSGLLPKMLVAPCAATGGRSIRGHFGCDEEDADTRTMFTRCCDRDGDRLQRRVLLHRDVRTLEGEVRHGEARKMTTFRGTP